MVEETFDKCIAAQENGSLSTAYVCFGFVVASGFITIEVAFETVEGVPESPKNATVTVKSSLYLLLIGDGILTNADTYSFLPPALNAFLIK